MPVYELYSTRKRLAERGAIPDVYQYDTLPDRLRTQIRQILTAALGTYHQHRSTDWNDVPNNNEIWDELIKILRRELGVDILTRAETPHQEIMSFLRTAEVDDALSVVELCTRCIDRIMSIKGDIERVQLGVTQEAKDALKELNYRFRAAGVGYEYASGEIIRVDSQFIHREVVKVALTMLSDSRFRGAEEEFVEAHRHHRNGDAKEAVTGANRAFESTMKAICDMKGWTYKKSARATDLIKVLKAKSLFPDYLDNSFDQLLATLGSGLPQLRNNSGGHGQGATPRPTPGYIAAFALHLAATNIVFLVDAALSESLSASS